jgi:hypothetical protein
MLGKVGKSRVGAKGPGKSPFADLVNYIAREADGKGLHPARGREVDQGEMGVLNLDADVEDLDMDIRQMDLAAARTAKFALPTNQATFSAG